MNILNLKNRLRLPLIGIAGTSLAIVTGCGRFYTSRSILKMQANYFEIGKSIGRIEAWGTMATTQENICGETQK